MHNPRPALHFLIAISATLLIGTLSYFMQITPYGSQKPFPTFEQSFKEVWIYIPTAKQWERVELSSKEALADQKIFKQLKAKYSTPGEEFMYSKLFHEEFRLKWIIPQSQYADLSNPTFSVIGFFLNDTAKVLLNQKTEFEFRRYRDPFFFATLDPHLKENVIEIKFNGLDRSKQNSPIINLQKTGINILEARDALSLIIQTNTKFDQMRIFALGLLLFALGFVFILHLKRSVGLEYGYHTILMAVFGMYYTVDMRRSIMHLEGIREGLSSDIRSILLLSMGAWMLGFILSFFRIRKKNRIHSDFFILAACSICPLLTWAVLRNYFEYSPLATSGVSKSVLLITEAIGFFLSAFLFRTRWKSAQIDPLQKHRARQCLMFTLITGASVLVFSVSRPVDINTLAMAFMADIIPVLGFCVILILDYVRKEQLVETADMQQNPLDTRVRLIGEKAIPKNRLLSVATFDIIGYTQNIFQPLLNSQLDGFQIFHQKTLSLYFFALRALHYDSMEFAGDKITAFFLPKDGSIFIKRDDESILLLDALGFLKCISHINSELSKTFQHLMDHYGVYTAQSVTRGTRYQIRSALDVRPAAQIWLDQFTNTVKFTGDVIHLPARMEHLAMSNESALTDQNFIQLKNRFPELFSVEPRWVELNLVQQKAELKGVGIPVPKIALIDLTLLDFEKNPETRLRYQKLMQELNQSIREMETEIFALFPIHMQNKKAA